MPTGPGAFTGDERLTVCAQPRVQLSLCNAEPARRDCAIAGERSAERGGDSRAGTIVECVTLCGEETESAPGITKLPARMVDIAARGIGREPAYVLVRRLGEQRRHVRCGVGAKRAASSPLLDHGDV